MAPDVEAERVGYEPRSAMIAEAQDIRALIRYLFGCKDEVVIFGCELVRKSRMALWVLHRAAQRYTPRMQGAAVTSDWASAGIVLL